MTTARCWSNIVRNYASYIKKQFVFLEMQVIFPNTPIIYI